VNTNIRIAIAEAIGTMVLVIGGPGTAIFATGLFGADPGSLNVGTLGVSLAFGLALLAMAYTIGNISGCHINPAVTIGLLVLGKIEAATAAVYIAAQIVGGIIGGLFIYLVVMGGPDGSLDRVQAAGFASNGYDTHSPGLFNLASVAATEIVLTAVFVMIVVATSRRTFTPGFTGLSVGLALTLIHLISIPISNTSVNPARSIATAVFQGDWALGQVWAFIVFPIIGAVIGGALWRYLVQPEEAEGRVVDTDV
jgi:aquaporin Z